MNKINEFFEFLKKSPDCFHAVKNITETLEKSGFSSINEGEKWQLKKGGKYFVTRNGSSIIAFIIPQNCGNSGFKICASHSDSPSFKIKENPEIKSGETVVLNVEKYGGMLLNPWFDRPLSISGRIVLNGKNGIESRLVNFDRDLVMLPNLAIHMDRNANDGKKIDVQKEIRPVLSLNKDKNLKSMLCEEFNISEKDLISSDLFLYNRVEPKVWGAENEFISASRLDDLECAYFTLKGFLSASENSGKTPNINVYAVFDNEEVGSQSFQGAASTFLKDVLERINYSLEGNFEDYKIRLSKSFMVSADNAHAIHPNYAEKADPNNRPVLNGGVVIKFNAAQKYTSDGISSAVFKNCCKRAGVPFQVYTNNSNLAGGSTLGNISQSQVSIPSVDIGLAQWAMHSPYESAGVKDCEYLEKAVGEFYNYGA